MSNTLLLADEAVDNANDSTTAVSVKDFKSFMKDYHQEASKQQKAYVDGKSSDIQVDELPEATADNLGKIYQYVGPTNDTYTSGKFYKSTYDSNTYTWTEVLFGSENDFTDELKEAYDQAVIDSIANKAAIETLNGTSEGSISKTVADEIAKVVANAPEDFNTLKEMSDWIQEHSQDAAEMNTAILAKLDKNQGTENAGKVLRVDADGYIKPAEEQDGHLHDNKTVLDKLTESSGNLLFNGKEIIGGGSTTIHSTLNTVTVGNSVKYAEGEQIVGSWIDGRPVYRQIASWSTPIESGTSFLPEMTSPTAPAPYEITDNTSSNSWKAYDSVTYVNTSDAGCYWLAYNTLPAWSMIKLDEPRVFTAISIYGVGSSYINRLPKTFKIEGSNDGETFTTLLDVDQAPAANVNNYTFERTAAYQYYRIYITAISRDSSVPLSIDKLVYFEQGESHIDGFGEMIHSHKLENQNLYIHEYTKSTDEPGSFVDPDLQKITVNNYHNWDTYYQDEEIVIGEWIDGRPIYRMISDTIYVNDKSLYKETELIPILSEDNNNIICSSIYGSSSYKKYYAFDGNVNTEWCSDNSSGNAFIGYDFLDNKYTLTKVIYNKSYKPECVSKIILQGSNDKSVWENIQTWVLNVDYTTDEIINTKTFEVNNYDTPYSKYRLYISSTEWTRANIVQFIGIDYESNYKYITNTEINFKDMYKKYLLEYIKLSDEPNSFTPDMLPGGAQSVDYEPKQEEIEKCIEDTLAELNQ